MTRPKSIRKRTRARVDVIEALESRLLLTHPMVGEDVSVVPVWTGERDDMSGQFLTHWGGNPVRAENLSFTTQTVYSGRGAYRFHPQNGVPRDGFDFFGISLTGFFRDYVDTRDITPYSDVVMQVKNETGESFSLVFEIKDHRDDNNHRARWQTVISSDPGWREIAIPLNLSSAGWTVIGNPDLSRTKLFSFVVEANQGEMVDGDLFFDELVMIERGGSLDPRTAPSSLLWRRMFDRQFQSLFGSRDRVTGLLPTDSSFNEVMGLNVTAGLVKTLPSAFNNGLITVAEANDYVERLTRNLDRAMNDTKYLPARYLDRVTLAPNFFREESPVDAAFMYLGLYQYRNLPSTPATLRTQIDSVLERFNFAPFASNDGWKLAFLIDSQTFTEGTYNGYSGEVWVISLAAHLAGQVDISDQYHSATLRARAFLTDPSLAHVVHSNDEFRAAFLQWLFPLFVDVSQRGN